MSEKRGSEDLRDKTPFRFQDLDIWKLAIEIGDALFDIADELEHKRLYRFAEQLRGAGLSTSNNIAEGSGSFSDRDFAHFCNQARRSTFENANMIIVLERRGLIGESKCERLLEKLSIECRMIANFIRSLTRAKHGAESTRHGAESAQEGAESEE